MDGRVEMEKFGKWRFLDAVAFMVSIWACDVDDVTDLPEDGRVVMEKVD